MAAMCELHSRAGSENVDKTVEIFRVKFPECASDELYYGVAPGRIEILGNHTDYNEGFILSAAIDKCTLLVGSKTSDRIVSLYTESMDASICFSLDDDAKYSAESGSSWANYPKGVIRELCPPGGFVGVLTSNIPVGGGVSSSAAIELATAMLLKSMYPSVEQDTMKLILACKKAENDFVGMGCGVLDQYTSGMGRAGQLIFLDCRDIYKQCYIPLSPEVRFVITNSLAPHQLVDGKYNSLRAECFEAAALFGVPFLRDVSLERFNAEQAFLPANVRSTASHIVNENDRVLRGMGMLEGVDLGGFGALMTRSHQSSSEDFGNSCPELDKLVGCAVKLPGCLGSRLMGGGFGGCTISLVRAEAVETFRMAIVDAYRAEAGITTSTFVVTAGDGANGGRL
jgi:galactokinase